MMLETIRQSLDITDAEHEQVTRAASAGSRRPDEEASAAAATSTTGNADAGASTSGRSDAARIGGPGNRVRFGATRQRARGPIFEGSMEVGSGDWEYTEDKMYVLSWVGPS
jgi:hypothetical protein